VEELLGRGAKVDDDGGKGAMTPLHMAAANGELKMMTKLISKGADPNFVCNRGPVINSAIGSGKIETIKLLLDEKVKVEGIGNIVPPLALAANISDVSFFKEMLEYRPGTFTPIEWGQALIQASYVDDSEICDLLLKGSVDEEYLQPALNIAVEAEHWDIMKLILSHRAGLDCEEAFYFFAISEDSNEEGLKLLWDYSKQSIPMTAINAALYQATDYERDSTVQTLITTYNADANATGKE
jgi:hypothetical protein